jgi:hypothetical protein
MVQKGNVKTMFPSILLGIEFTDAVIPAAAALVVLILLFVLGKAKKKK